MSDRASFERNARREDGCAESKRPAQQSVPTTKKAKISLLSRSKAKEDAH